VILCPGKTVIKSETVKVSTGVIPRKRSYCHKISIQLLLTCNVAKKLCIVILLLAVIFSFIQDATFLRSHSKCKSLMKWLSHLSVPREISKTKQDNRREIYRKSGSPSKNTTSYFVPEITKYPKSSPKPQNFERVRAYCFVPLAMQLYDL